MLMLMRQFHSNIFCNSRFPALPTKISRQSNIRNQKKIEKIKVKLGQKYAEIGRDKRQSPYSENRSPSKPTQPEKQIEKIGLIQQFLLKKDHIPDNIDINLKENIKKPSSKISSDLKIEKKHSLRNAVFEKKLEIDQSKETKLSLPEKSIPQITIKDDIEQKTLSGPFYQFGITPSEIDYILNELPNEQNDQYSIDKRNLQQAEIVRRIISVDSSSQKNIKKFNIQRVIEIFQRNALDTGSSEVQGIFFSRAWFKTNLFLKYSADLLAAVMMVKINDMKTHLEKCPKDKSTKRRLQAWISKQKLILKYLKRKVFNDFI